VRPARIIVAVLVGGLLGGIAWLIGFAVEFAIAWGLVAAALVLLSAALATTPPPIWPPAPPEDRIAPSSVSRLAWAFDMRRGRAASPAVGRVRAILAHRLRRTGVELEDDAHRERVIAVVGSAEIVQRLIDGTSSVRELQRILDVAERIEVKEES